ncbi:MAG: flagellar hook-associated family protein [Pseudomonadota bacterium]
MKISQVSTSSMFNLLRSSTAGLQRDLVDAQREVTTGQRADPGHSLGERNALRLSLLQDIERLNTITETNGLALARLEISELALESIGEIGDALLPALVASVGQGSSASIASNAGQSALAELQSTLNTTFNGEHIFGGINSSVPPLENYQTSGAKLELEAQFTNHFGFPPDDSSALTIDKSQMAGFLDVVLEPALTGAGWTTHVSAASDHPIRARIGLNETRDVSVSANESGAQKMVLAGIISSEFLSGTLGGGAQDAVLEKAIGLVTSSQAEIADLRGDVGLTTNRIQRSNERMVVQNDEMERYAVEMTSVDPFEAATRMNSLLTQIETSYTLTGRIQQLSLMRFI